MRPAHYHSKQIADELLGQSTPPAFEVAKAQADGTITTAGQNYSPPAGPVNPPAGSPVVAVRIGRMLFPIAQGGFHVAG